MAAGGTGESGRPASRSERATRFARLAALGLTLPFVLAAVLASAGLVVHTAGTHDLQNGAFAVFFAALSTRAALSWVQWRTGEQPPG